MGVAAAPTDMRRQSRRSWAVAAALLMIGTACLAWGLREHQHSLPGPAAFQQSMPSVPDGTLPALPRTVVPTVVPTVSPVTVRSVTVRSVPVALRIPAIALAVPLSALGLNPDGTVQVPTDFSEPGWFRLGPSPGQRGSAVILGHVDSYQGPAVFFQLRSLRAGDRVDVRLADGVVAHFAVNSVAMYLKEDFPAREVYGSHGYPALQLVTCGGVFDTQTGHYLSNVVVYTTLVSTTAVAAPRVPSSKRGRSG